MYTTTLRFIVLIHVKPMYCAPIRDGNKFSTTSLSLIHTLIHTLRRIYVSKQKKNVLKNHHPLHSALAIINISSAVQ